MTTYNGWASWETWAATVWIDGEEASSRYYREVAQSADTLPGAAMALNDAFRGTMPEFPPGWVRDVVLVALGNVSWEEIAESFREE